MPEGMYRVRKLKRNGPKEGQSVEAYMYGREQGEKRVGNG